MNFKLSGSPWNLGLTLKVEASVLFNELRTYLEEGVLGATLDITRPPDITGFDMVAAVKAPHISSFVSFYRVILIFFSPFF